MVLVSMMRKRYSEISMYFNGKVIHHLASDFYGSNQIISLFSFLYIKVSLSKKYKVPHILDLGIMWM
jgi:hypothetical protein